VGGWLMLARTEGWESRLAAAVDGARLRPYQLGAHDCFSFACEAVEAMTGVDLYTNWRGRYNSKTSALRLIAEEGGFSSAFSRIFGVLPSGIAMARRGDILEYRADGEQHLAVCVGDMAAALGEHGLLFIETCNCGHAWRIG
jgi:hypothetical protein